MRPGERWRCKGWCLHCAQCDAFAFSFCLMRVWPDSASALTSMPLDGRNGTVSGYDGRRCKSSSPTTTGQGRCQDQHPPHAPTTTWPPAMAHRSSASQATRGRGCAWRASPMWGRCLVPLAWPGARQASGFRDRKGGGQPAGRSTPICRPDYFFIGGVLSFSIWRGMRWF